MPALLNTNRISYVLSCFALGTVMTIYCDYLTYHNFLNSVLPSTLFFARRAIFLGSPLATTSASRLILANL